MLRAAEIDAGKIVGCGVGENGDGGVGGNDVGGMDVDAQRETHSHVDGTVG